MSAVTFVISKEVTDALREREERDNLTHAQAVMAAYAHSSDHLPRLVQEHLGLGNITLDPFALPFHNQHRPAGTPTAQVGLRLPTATLEAIDELAAKTGAPSRARLTEVALEHWLKTTS